MSDLLHFSEHTLQEVALLFMALVYTIRVVWFLRFKAGKERQAPTAPQGIIKRRGIIYSWANIATPWAMESSRTQPLFYAQFVIFHLGVTAAITLSFVIPYGPGLLEYPGVILATQLICGAACVVGLMRIYRRVTNPYIRAISSPDDFFSPVLLTIWLLSAVLAAPNSTAGGEWRLLAYFILTAFFLVYVPFSKISHYLYYPFTRYYLGKTMSRRGVYPARHGGRTATSGEY
jgi:nitrate reductase gamma subunit